MTGIMLAECTGGGGVRSDAVAEEGLTMRMLEMDSLSCAVVDRLLLRSSC